MWAFYCCLVKPTVDSEAEQTWAWDSLLVVMLTTLSLSTQFSELFSLHQKLQARIRFSYLEPNTKSLYRKGKEKSNSLLDIPQHSFF